MFPTLQIGPLAVQTPGLILLIGLWIGMNLSEKRASQFNVNPRFVYDIVIISILAGLVAGRAAYAARYLDSFLTSPLSFVSPNPLLFDLQAGILVALLTGIIVTARRRLSIWSMLDAFTPLFAVFAVAVGFAHLANGTAFGAPSNLPWTINLWGENRHPSQVYEIITSLIILIIIVIKSKNVDGSIDYNPTPAAGVLFLTFLALSSGSRLFLEAFRGDSTLTLYQLRLPQLISWIILALSLLILGQKRRAGKSNLLESTQSEIP